MQTPPIHVVHLFPVLNQELVSLLKTLTADEWQAPTIAKKWRVKDIAAHILDTHMRTISLADNYMGDPPEAIGSYADLVAYLNKLNADWVQAMKRVSPAQLIFLLEATAQDFCRLMAELPLFEPARFAVDWAGEALSLNWFHVAREYTENWHHQMQIRDAVGKPGNLFSPEFFYPCIDTFMYALPHTLRNTKAAENTTIKVSVTGEAGGNWFANYLGGRWNLSKQQVGEWQALVELPPNTAWKLFTKGITAEQALETARLVGDERLGKAVLGMVSVMA